MKIQLHQRATAQTRRRIAAWRERKANPPQPEKTTLSERVLATLAIAIMLALIAWPIYGLFAD